MVISHQDRQPNRDNPNNNNKRKLINPSSLVVDNQIEFKSP